MFPVSIRAIARRLCLALGLLYGSWALAAAPNPPAVLFAGSDGGSCGYEVLGRLAQSGFALRAEHSSLSARPLLWDAVKNCNVVVLSGLGRANADMSLGATQQTIDTLHRFLETGGGVLMLGSFGQMATEKPPQDALLRPLGLTPLFDEAIDDPQAAVAATAWKIRFARTDAMAASPIAAGVTSLWYPVPRERIGAQNHTIPLVADKSWQILVRGSSSSLTHKGPLQQSRPTAPGTYQERAPFAASRAVGKGRLIYLGITQEYLIGPYANSTLDGIVLDRGLSGRPSYGYRLLENALRWLAEPSLAEGRLGGAAMDASLLANPHKVERVAPYVWPKKPGFPAVEPALTGLIGARTRFSSGKADPVEWVQKAKSAGLDWIVFLEQFSQLSPENYQKLRDECHRLSSPGFTALPGFTIDDEIGNHYFYFGASFPYPDRKFLTPDGKAFRSHNSELNPKNPHRPGQLAMTVLDYSYTISSFKLTAGNYLFHRNAAPFADFFSDYDAMGVVTCLNGRVIEDATDDYLKLCASGQSPLPLVIDLMDDPAFLSSTPWRTVLRLPKHNARLVAGPLKDETQVSDYFSLWHFYADNPTKPQITSGPHIESWCSTGPGGYDSRLRGAFVWQNYRGLVHGRVTSSVGLKEVAIYDGTRLFRRFLPGAKMEFECTVDLTHDRQHDLVLIATDSAGRRAVSGNQWDTNTRLEEVMCADRNNQLSYGQVINKEGIGIELGGNQTLGTTIKRISAGISPSGTFKNDKLLGVPAFDGGASGEPEIFEGAEPLGPPHPVQHPVVTEARRLLHTSDVMIGDGVREHAFTDNIPVHNVWGTLWRTEPVKEYSVNRRNHFFQINPENPLAVFLWQVDVVLKQDVPNQGFFVANAAPREAGQWSLRGDDGKLRRGKWDKAEKQTGPLSVPFGRTAYAAFLDSPLGGAAFFSLTDGLTAYFDPRYRGSLSISMPAATTPTKKGETRQVQLLVVGIPRPCSLTRHFPPSAELVDRFFREFGLHGGAPAYRLRLEQGSLLSHRYILAIDGKSAACMSGELSGNLFSSLPISVANLNDRWSVFLHDRLLKQSRPLGILEGKAWAVVNLEGKADLFIGHPIMVDDAKLFVQLTQCEDQAWTLEVHNPTDAAVTTRIRVNPFFDPLKEKADVPQTATIPAGTSLVWKL